MPKPTPSLRLRRREAGLKVSELAERVRCTPKHLKNVESGWGGLSHELAHRIATVLGISVEEIFGADDGAP